MAKRQVSGIFLLNKDAGITSSQALVRVRAIYQAQKGGHTGALDPFAEGLLPICLGEAAKFSCYFLEGNKKYIATGRLGITTTTCDPEGEIVAERPVGDALARLPEVLKSFTGTIEQVPPIYSAVKVAGRPLYKYARQGLEVEIPRRTVTIHSIRLLDCTEDSFKVEVYCSKGTYIRTLLSDIGEALGCGAYVTALRRTMVEGLPQDQMISLAQLQQICDAREDKRDFTALDNLLLPLDLAVAALPAVSLPYDQAEPLTHGVRQGPDFSRAQLPEGGTAAAGPLRILYQNTFIGVAQFEDGILVPKRMMAPYLINPEDRKGCLDS